MNQIPQPITKEDLEIAMQNGLTSFRENFLKQDLQNLRNEIAIDMMNVFVTKDDLHSELDKLREEMATKQYVDQVIVKSDEIIRMLEKREAEEAATTVRMDRHEKAIEKLAHHVGRDVW